VILAFASETNTFIGAGAVLVGVIAGGAVTAGTTGYFERRRDRADMRQGCRLVAEEVRTVWNHLDLMIRSASYPRTLGSPPRFLPSDQWNANRSVLARHLDDDTWDTVSPFMDSIRTTRELIEAAPLNSPIPQAMLEEFTTSRSLAREACALLTGRDEVSAGAQA
jgi:hypothetical protein